jgi:hypothetical protein
MRDTPSRRELDERIEELVREHMAAVERSACEAIDRAFARASGAARKPAQARVAASAEGKKRNGESASQGGSRLPIISLILPVGTLQSTEPSASRSSAIPVAGPERGCRRAEYCAPAT